MSNWIGACDLIKADEDPALPHDHPYNVLQGHLNRFKDNMSIPPKVHTAVRALHPLSGKSLLMNKSSNWDAARDLCKSK